MTVIYAARIAGRVVYVGISRCVWSRMLSHKYKKTHDPSRKEEFRQMILSGVVSFYIIRVTNNENRHRIEGQIISAFKRKGQCEYNSATCQGGDPVPGDPRFLGSAAAGNFRDDYPPGTSITPVAMALIKKCACQRPPNGPVSGRAGSAGGAGRAAV